MLQDMVKNQGWPADPELERKAIAAWGSESIRTVGRVEGWTVREIVSA